EERLPVITYEQLASGTTEDNVVLVDLRPETAAKAAAGAGVRAMSVQTDEVAEFAARLGVSVVQGAEVRAGAAGDGRVGAFSAGLGANEAAMASRAKVGQSQTGPTPLLVLVAEDEAEAAA